MKKVFLPIAVSLVLALTACTDAPKTAPLPTPSMPVVTTPNIPAPTTPKPTRTTDEPTTEPTTQEPTAAPTSSATPGAEPPAVQFLKTWGSRYPSVSERSIADAAKPTCARIAAEGDGWMGDDEVTSDVVAFMEKVGMLDVSKATADAFAADANVRYCPLLG